VRAITCLFRPLPGGQSYCSANLACAVTSVAHQVSWSIPWGQVYPVPLKES